MAVSTIRNTPSIVEQGTSGIWTYRKWSDGIAECWGDYSASIAVNTTSPSYGGYRSASLSVAFPFTFTSVPKVVATMGSGSGGAWVNNGGDTTTSAFGFLLSCGASLSSSTRHVVIYAIGKWS